MAGKISPAAQGRLNELALILEKVHRAHGLVETYAASRTSQDQYVLPMTRIFQQLKMHLMGAGLDSMSQLAGSMEIAARRGTSATTKVRILREGVASLRFQIELEQRAIVSAEVAAQQTDNAEKELSAGD
jgi:hypothetical protein